MNMVPDFMSFYAPDLRFGFPIYLAWTATGRGGSRLTRAVELGYYFISKFAKTGELVENAFVKRVLTSNLSKSAKLLILFIGNAIEATGEKSVLITVDEFMEIGLSNFTVINTLKELEQQNVLVREKKQGKSYHYALKTVSSWKLQ